MISYFLSGDSRSFYLPAGSLTDVSVWSRVTRYDSRLITLQEFSPQGKVAEDVIIVVVFCSAWCGIGCQYSGCNSSKLPESPLNLCLSRFMSRCLPT